MAVNMPERSRMACLTATVHGQVLSAAVTEADGAMAFFTGRAHTHGAAVTATQDHI
jgi:hypothetical protein